MFLRFNLVKSEGESYLSISHSNRQASGLNEKQKMQEVSVWLYPNPTHSSNTIVFSAQGQTTVRLIDINGQELKTIFEGVVHGKTSIVNDVSQMPAGLYIYKIESSHGFQAVRFMKSN
jgi:hypothetical protein